MSSNKAQAPESIHPQWKYHSQVTETWEWIGSRKREFRFVHLKLNPWLKEEERLDIAHKIRSHDLSHGDVTRTEQGPIPQKGEIVQIGNWYKKK